MLGDRGVALNTASQGGGGARGPLAHDGPKLAQLRKRSAPCPAGEPQHFLNFFPLPHVQGSFGPGFATRTAGLR